MQKQPTVNMKKNSTLGKPWKSFSYFRHLKPGAIISMLALAIVAKADSTWTGGVSTDWNDPANWNPTGVPAGAGNNAIIDILTGNIATISSSISGTPQNIIIGDSAGSGRLDHVAGTAQTGAGNPMQIAIGANTPTGTYNLANTAGTGGVLTGFGLGSGTMNVNGDLQMGDTAGNTAVINMNTTGGLNVQGAFNVGGMATATVNVDAGAVVANNNINIGVNTGVGTFNQSGGSVTANMFDVGNGSGSSGVLTVSGGTATASGAAFWLGVQLGQNGGNGTLNLDGGTLTTRMVRSLTSIGSGTLNFNGGVLKAKAALSVYYDAFLQDLTAINVRNGGAIIDTAGFDVITSDTVHFNHSTIGGDNAIDGGLTKNGNGTLRIITAGDFTGPVVVNGGTLYANAGNGANSRNFSYCSGITINNGATLQSSANALFGYDGTQVKPITINAGGTMTADNGADVGLGMVTLAGGTLTSVGSSIYWGSWVFNAVGSGLTVVSNSTVSAVNVKFGSGTIDIASGKTLSFPGTITDANFGGQSGLVLTGSGTLLLSGANTYSGNTAVNGGTLALASSGSIANTANITLAAGTTFDVSAAGGFTVAAGKALRGNGTVVGNIATTGASSVIAPGVGGVGTLTFTGNLNLGSGSAPVFEVSTTAASGNDQVVVSGNLTLSSSDTIHISALSGAANLDQTADYVLFSVAGTTTMATTPSLAWDGTPPGNYLNYKIAKVGQNVVLQYTTATSPSVTATATPTSVMRNNPVTIAATVTQGSGNIASVTVDATAIGGSASAALVQDVSQLPSLVYTNTFVVGAATLAGAQPLTAFVADDTTPTPLVGTYGFSVTVTVEGDLTWNGLAADNNWTSNLNWASGYAPGYVGDSLTFAGTTRLTPNMDASYSLTGLTFDGSAGSFTIGTANGSVLTNGANGIVNNSANAQTLNVPLKLSASQIINAAAGDITLGGGVGGIGAVNMTTLGAGAVTLSGSGTGTLNDVIVQNHLKITSGTTIVDSGLQVGNGLTGVVTLSGGTLSAINGAFWVSVQLGQNGGDGTFNLDGGTLVARSIRSLGGTTGAATMNFNGGTLKASMSLTFPWDTILEELTAINVRNGGAIIDTAGFDILIPAGQPLNHSSIGGDNATDGGLTKNGNGTLTLNSYNTYTGPTKVNAGTLAGNGTIQGVLTNGATLAPGDAGVGALTVNGDITLKTGSTNTFTVNGTTLVNSSINAGAAVTYGGMLKIVPSGTFTAGQSFTLFSGASVTSPSNFSSIVGSPGSGLFFSFTNGVLSVASAGPSGPASLTNSVSGNTLSLSWPAGQGWRLQMQTNSLSTGLSSNWVYITDGSVSSTNITVDVTKPTVFYRLTYP